MKINIGIKHPPPVTILPIFLCLPDFVNGIPICLDSLDLAADKPEARFHEKPPLFIKLPSHFFIILSEGFEK
jgi:hypothetical protein